MFKDDDKTPQIINRAESSVCSCEKVTISTESGVTPFKVNIIHSVRLFDLERLINGKWNYVVWVNADIAVVKFEDDGTIINKDKGNFNYVVQLSEDDGYIGTHTSECLETEGLLIDDNDSFCFSYREIKAVIESLDNCDATASFINAINEGIEINEAMEDPANW